MKNILFVCYGLGIGGIEKCLVNLLNALPESQFNIDLLLMNPEYDMKNDIKINVNYLNSFKYVMNTTDTMRQIKENGGILRNTGKCISYARFRMDVKARKPKVWKHFKCIDKKYDVAIAYSQNDYSPYYVIDKVQADKKVLWYHNGAYDKTDRGYELDKEYYPRFDYIVAVSNDCANVLKEKFNFDDNKVIVLRNICDLERIKCRADEFIPESYRKEALHITTVGRLTKEKGADMVVDVCRLLKNENINFIWHWVGDGNQRSNISDLIEHNSLGDVLILEGNQENPYPYIKGTDIYVQPSLYEAYSTTITEAKVLKRPIITTDVGGMRDQLTDGINGYIVPISPEEIYVKLIEMYNDVSIGERFIRNLSENNVDNQASLKEYYNTVFL